MLDPAARIDRRVWTSCSACPDGSNCPTCQSGRTCDQHWRFLLDVDGSHLFVQCPNCFHRWWHDTGFGAGGRPAGVTEVAQFWPPSSGDGMAA
jgi:hypothetical protein